MQILTAFAVDPGYRPEAFEHVRNLADPMINGQNASPTGAMQRQLPFLLHDGDPRWAPPLPVDVATLQFADMRQTLAGPLSKGAIDVTIVGDVSVDQAIAAVSKTFGALPPRAAAQAPSADSIVVRFPQAQATPVVRKHAGREDQAVFVVAWPVADGRGDLQTSRNLRILEQTIKSRLFAQFRVADGASYEADTGLETSQIFPGYGYIYAFAEAPPDKEALFYDTVAKITADLRQHALTPDELERARQPRVELFTRARQTNGYWLGSLDGVQRDPRRLDVVRTTIPALKAVTSADVQKMAQTYLDDAHIWKLNIEPRDRVAPPASPRPTGIANLNCARAQDNHVKDCHVVRESPPGRGVGAVALMLAPSIKVTSKLGDSPVEARVQFDLQAPIPDPGP
jgi:zinc protease